MLVQSLLEIQERYGYLPEAELEFLALRAGVPLYRVQEVTTFFPHFRREKPARVALHVCQSMSCHLRGAQGVLEEARGLVERHGPEALEVHAVSCLGRCDRAPAALLGQHTHEGNGAGHREMLFTEVGTRHKLGALVGDALAGKPLRPDRDWRTDERPDWQIDVYRPGQDRSLSAAEVGGGDAPPAGYVAVPGGFVPQPYAAVRRFLAGELDAAGVINQLKLAGLVGMGGAAARTYNKWQEVRTARGQARYIICNADESEPGTFKDRELLLRTPHLVVEGMLIAGLTVGASRGYIYTRHEYPEQIAACDAEIARARQQVPEAMAKCPIETFTSPGLYICGEESALIEVIEGKRAQPRNQPPSIRENGLFDQPTVVNNVETYAWVPSILLRQPREWYQQGPLRFFSISGDVKRPGVFEVPFTCTLGELVELAGGMRDGKELYAAATSGPSGGFLPPTLDAERVRQALDRAIPRLGDYDPHGRVAEFRKTITGDRVRLLDLPLNVNAFRAMGLALGAAIIIYGAAKGERADMLDHARNCLEFFHKESCGKCVPCRLGAGQLAGLAGDLQAGRVELPQVQDTVRAVAGVMKVASICGLGRAASVPLMTWMEHFGR